MATYKNVFTYKGIEVTERGGVRRVYKNNSSYSTAPSYNTLTFKTDGAGNRIVRTRDYGDLRVDELVARAFLGNPRGKQKFVIHKDKEKEHCWKDNLKWATAYEHGEFYSNDPAVNDADGFRLVDSNLYVSRDGKVKMNGSQVTILDYIYDSDLNAHRAVDPFIEYPYIDSYGKNRTKKCSVDDLVAEAFVAIPSGLSCPTLIHKDGDYKNSKAINLEWADSNSSLHQKYIEKCKIEKEKRNMELAIEFSDH